MKVDVNNATTDEESISLLPKEEPKAVEKPEYKNETKENIEWYQRWEKNRLRILLLVSFSALLAPALSTLFLPALNFIIIDLDSTQEFAALLISVFLAASGVFPLAWGIFVDKMGRKQILLLSLSLTILTSIACSFAWNIYFLLAARTMQAIGLCASQIVGASSIADVYPKALRASALGIWGLTFLLGPIVGPLAGGIVAEFLGWRWMFRGAAMYAGMMSVLVIFFLPDTLRRDGPNAPPKSWNIFLPLKLLTNITILFPCLSQAIMFSVMYFVLYMIPIELEKNFGFNQLEIGLSMLPLGVGLLLGSFIGGKVADYLFRKYGSGGRMVTAYISLWVIIAPINLFAGFVKTQYVVCFVCFFFIGFSLQFGRPGLVSFAIERRPTASASVTSCFLFMNSGVFGFTITTFGPYVVEMIGIKLTFFILTGVILLITLTHFYIMYWFWNNKN